MRTLLVVSLLLVPALAGCMGSGGASSASVYVKDAPTDEFEEIHVVFTRVSVHKAESEDDNATTAEGEVEDRIVLFRNDDGVDIDLLATQGNKAAFLGETTLDPGQYTQIRVEVEEAYGIMDGERVPFDVPSDTLKIVRSFTVEDGRESRIVVDLDLDRSIRETGRGEWIMTPVIGKTRVETVDGADSGADVAQEGEIVDIPAES